MKRKVILAVTESDAHVVANHLIAYQLRHSGYEVVNLGACTSVQDLSAAYSENSDAMAILIGSLNGHAREDLKDLPALSEKASCPIIVGGNLSVGSQKLANEQDDFFKLGATHVLQSHHQVLPLLADLECNLNWRAS